MLPYQRLTCLEQVVWNKSPHYLQGGDSIAAFECWKYGNVKYSQQDTNFRVLTLAHQPRQAGIAKGDVEERVEKWLNWEESFAPLPPPKNAGKLDGGIRLVFCERPNTQRGMTISKHTFKAVENSFGLHPATLPTFFYVRGAFSSFTEKEPGKETPRRLQVVIKATQKAEVANYLLSMSFDVATSWTTALICGYGVFRERQLDKEFGFQMKQIIDAITASTEAWNNPLFIPYILLHNSMQRIEVSADITDGDILNVEDKLGIGANRFFKRKLNVEREKWVQSIDPQEMTMALHTILPHVGFMSSSYKWLSNYAQFLLELEGQLRTQEAFRRHLSVFNELQDSISFLISAVNGEMQHFSTLQSRGGFLVNLLFNVITQQDSILNRWDSRLNQTIAKSAKQDSISMTTFTFITALFLPGTFIATLFSMTMFDWQADNDTETNNSASPYVSSKLWLFWAIAVPLTVITLGGWHFWFKHANSRWIKQLQAAASSTEHPESAALAIKSPEFPLSRQANWLSGAYCEMNTSGGVPLFDEEGRRQMRSRWHTRCTCTNCCSNNSEASSLGSE